VVAIASASTQRHRRVVEGRAKRARGCIHDDGAMLPPPFTDDPADADAEAAMPPLLPRD
jgi:hypothetical protein